MSELNPNPPTPPEIPPKIPSIPGKPPALGDDPAERVPIRNVFGVVEAILRQPRRMMFQLGQPGAGRLISQMLLTSLVCGLVYGLIIGSFSGGEQWWAAPVKFTGGLFVSAVICLPSLYIFAGLSGSTARPVEILGLVAGLLLLMTLLLVGFAPVAWLFSESTNSTAWMGSLHLLIWLIATTFGMRFVAAGARQNRTQNGAGLKTWAVIFVLVALQMSTALRPLLGRSPNFLPAEKKFFLEHWGNCLNQANLNK